MRGRLLLGIAVVLLGCTIVEEVPFQEKEGSAEAPVATGPAVKVRQETPAPAIRNQPPLVESFDLDESFLSLPDESPLIESEPEIDLPQEPTPSTLGLPEYLVHRFGVEFPSGRGPHLLSPTIGPPPYEVALGFDTSGAQATDFPREILVTANLKDVFANRARSAAVECSKTGQKPKSVGSWETTRCFVDGGAQGQTERLADPLVVDSLRGELTTVLARRDELLREISEQAREWGLLCDFYTLAVHRDLTYEVLVQLLHTAALSDLTRARLVVEGSGEALGYVPLTMPRLDERQQAAAVVVGNHAWEEMSKRTDYSLEVALVGFVGALCPEDFRSLEPDSLPGCLPEDLSWLRPGAGSGQRREAARQFEEHRKGILATHGRVLGMERVDGDSGVCPSPPEVTEVPVEAVVEPVNRTAVGSPTARPKGDSPVQGEDSSVAQGEPQEVREPPALLRVEALRRLEAADWAIPIPMVYLEGEQLHVVLIGKQGLVLLHQTFPADRMDEILSALEPALGNALLFGAPMNTPISRVVEVLEQLQYRCSVRGMSGRCQQFSAFFPTVYLVVSPNGRFGSPATEPAPAPQPEVEKFDGGSNS